MRIFKKSMAIFLGTLIIASTSVLPRLSLSAEGTSKNNLIENYEGKEIDTAVGGGRVVDSGNSVHGKVISHTRNKAAVWEGDIPVGLDAARNAEYDGISFYVNNVTRSNSEKTPEILCFIRNEEGCVAQKIFKVQENGKFIKFTIWFENVGKYVADDNKKWNNTNSYGEDITEQRAELKSLEIRFRNTEVGDVFYFDDFRYEKKNVIETYEDKEIGKVMGGGRVVDSGNSVHGKVISHTRNKAAVWEGDIPVGLDAARNAEYDGISFYVNNVTRSNSEKIPEILCFIRNEEGCAAQKIFKVQENGKFIKFTIWFENVGKYDDGSKWWNTNNSGVDITGQRTTLKSLEIRFKNTEVGDVFYFDDFRYEKKNVIETYEDKEIGKVMGGGRVVDSGNSVHGKVISHTRNKAAVWEGDIPVGLDAARNAEYDGISFYVNNVTRSNSEKIPEILCFIRNEEGCAAQKIFKVQENGKFIKLTLWFNDVGRYIADDNKKWDNTSNSGVDITEQMATLKSLEIRFKNTEVGDVFYFDDFRYEKKKSSETDGVKAVDRLKRGINLSGPFENAEMVSRGSWILKKHYYSLLADKGFDHVRIPVNFGNHIGEAPNYFIDEEFMNAVDTAINNALETGLAAVLDFHGWNGTLASDFDGNKECFYRIWEQVSKRYQTYPEELMFELINEPNKPITDAQLNELQLETVKRIRKLNPTRTIALATNENNGTWKLWDTQIPANDDNLIISIHNYDTMAFTHQGADWLGDGYKNKIALDDNIKNSVKEHIEQCRYYEERTGRKVWISEWGVYQGIADKDDISQYADYFSGICRENKISYCYWEFCSGYGVYDINAGIWKEFLLNNLH